MRVEDDFAGVGLPVAARAAESASDEWSSSWDYADGDDDPDVDDADGDNSGWSVAVAAEVHGPAPSVWMRLRPGP